MYQLKEREIEALARCKEIADLHKEVADIYRKDQDYQMVIKLQEVKKLMIRRLLNREMTWLGLYELMRVKGIRDTYRKLWEPAKGRNKLDMSKHIARWAKW